MRQRAARSLVGRVVRRYDAAHANNWATVIAWNALFSFVPIVIAVVALFSLLLSRADFAATVGNVVGKIASSRQERTDILRTVNSLAQHRNLLISIALVGLLWSGSSLFAAMDNAISALYGVAARPFLVKRLRGMALVVVFTALLIPFLFSSALLSVGQTYSLLPAEIDGPLLIALQFIAGTLLATLIFVVIYRLLPNRGHTVRRTLPGALAAGLLLEALAGLFPLYEHATSGAATYGALIALLFLLLTFFFLLGQITVIGALVNLELDAVRATEVGQPPFSARAWSSTQ